ncbi:unnamed protein product [Closterium sp. NIES-65]|nr:unnamed protein product [Closterium sp. NIES-65]
MWKKLMKLVHNFLTGNNASAEKGFVLWNWGLLTTPKADGGLGVLDPEILLACLAARRIGGLLLDGNGKKKEIMLTVAGLPLGEDTFLAHERLMKHWPGDGERWRRACETFMKSPIADTGTSRSRAEVAHERVVFNRKLLMNGTNPVGGQKEAKVLWETRLGDLVVTTRDGGAEIKGIDTLEKELRSRDSARLALKAFDAAPQKWKTLLVPGKGREEEEGEVPPPADVPTVGVHAAATIFRSAVFSDGQLAPLKQLRETWAKPEAVLVKQAKCGPVTAPIGPVAAPNGPVAAPSGPVATLCGPVAAPSGPDAALCGLVAALRGPDAASSGPVAALRGPVAASSGPVAALRGPVAASSGPVAALHGPFSRQAAEPPSYRAAEPPSRRAAQQPSRPAAEPPSHRAEPPSRRAAEAAVEPPLPSRCRRAAVELLLFLPARPGLTHPDWADGLSLFDLTSGASPDPPADADSTIHSQWATRDAAARLAVRRHLPTAERAHFSQYKSAKTLYDAVVARYSSPVTAALSRLMLPYLFP